MILGPLGDHISHMPPHQAVNETKEDADACKAQFEGVIGASAHNAREVGLP